VRVARALGAEIVVGVSYRPEEALDPVRGDSGDERPDCPILEDLASDPAAEYGHGKKASSRDSRAH